MDDGETAHRHVDQMKSHTSTFEGSEQIDDRDPRYSESSQLPSESTHTPAETVPIPASDEEQVLSEQSIREPSTEESTAHSGGQSLCYSPVAVAGPIEPPSPLPAPTTAVTPPVPECISRPRRPPSWLKDYVR